MKARLAALLAAAIMVPAAALHAQAAKLTIVYVSKMPEMEGIGGVGGLPELATMVAQVRASSPYSLFLHGGDSLAPSAMSLFDRGTHMIDILNGIEPDVYAVNEREFAYKEDELILRIGEASFPFVCSNIFDPLSGGNLPGVEDSRLIELGGFRIGVFAIIDPLVTETYLPDRIRVKDVDATVAATSRALRAAGADIVILMSGYPVPRRDALLSAGTVDLVLESSSRDDAMTAVGKGFLVSQGTAAGTAAVVEMALERKGGTVRAIYAGRIIALKDYAPDPATSERVAYYRSVLSAFMDVPVGVAETPLDTTKKAVRTQETAFGDLVADAMREYYGADIAIVNGGGIRGNRTYAAGTTLTRKDIQSELPFGNKTRLVAVTGDQLREALENGFSQVEEEKGRFLQVSGITVTWCPTAPPGSRVRSILVGGKPLDPGKLYTLALLDFLLEGGDGYDVLRKAMPVKTSKTSLLVWDVVRMYIEQRKRVSPRVEGRLVVDCR